MPEGTGSAVELEPVIGLEIHVQLKTRTKMFCGCALSFGEEPNTRTCPVCLGHPGTLPVANEEAVHLGLRIALALGCEISERSIFHRKNYFYPDLPKGYQISQYDVPLAERGTLAVPGGPTVGITRVHLEEAGAKLGISRNTVFYRLHRARARNGGLTTFALMYELGRLVGREPEPAAAQEAK
ncbi:hypothetical protein LCGC14_0878460 [marine sediment metagenome]|uniref:Aspartyl/Glutamyl-tRNA(Gln) amidotransferase subunit B/E catalytic domain-containing protein n=1 Tax=marine sediment metagenome TaxID=412755 RepID=A0A0F9RMA3_9ZZZZ